MTHEADTRGIRALRDRGVSFRVVEYLFKEKGTESAAAATGWPEAKVVKTLVVRTGPKEHVFVLAPGDRELSQKKLARALGVRDVAMAELRDAERLTGYVAGGISAFGSFTALPVIIDESLFDHEEVLVNAGRRGVLVALSPWTIQELLDAKILDVMA